MLIDRRMSGFAGRPPLILERKNRDPYMVQSIRLKRKTEILAPAGSFESLKAAVNAGADAVYAGGKKFGARAFAANFSDSELLEAIDYVHLHGKKLYLTANTLMKQDEYTSLYDYIYPLYEHGLDAVIVQDMGAMNLILNHFPGVEVHASTQMSVMNSAGASFLKQLGVSRVVPGRELSVQEVQSICQTGIDVECFVHGALCYSVSGQCLMSSMAGGRSGNRGQCAQPCRMKYTSASHSSYMMSLKDICTLEHIPLMIDAGIHSFKIEGRMKKPEYVALVTSMYRKYTDLYEEYLYTISRNKQKSGTPSSQKDFVWNVSEDDVRALRDIYNRGGFSDGYMKSHNGRHMVSITKPSHSGVAVLTVESQSGRKLNCRCIEDIHSQDVIELSEKKDAFSNYTFGKSVKKGESVSLFIARNLRFKKGQLLYRTKNSTLIGDTRSAYIDQTKQIPLRGIMTLKKGEPASLFVISGNSDFHNTDCPSACASGSVPVSDAVKRPLDDLSVRKAVCQTGESLFYFQELDIQSDSHIFLPVNELKSVRRLALEKYAAAVKLSYRRNCPDPVMTSPAPLLKNLPEEKIFSSYSVSVETGEQLLAVRNYILSSPYSGKIGKIYISFHADKGLIPSSSSAEAVKELQSAGVLCFLSLPSLFRSEASAAFSQMFADGKTDLYDGLLIRSFDALSFIREKGYKKPLVLDHNLYCMNDAAVRFFKDRPDVSLTYPLELDLDHMKSLSVPCDEIIVYGYAPVMTSAQCVIKTTRGCTKCSDTVSMDAPAGEEYRVCAVCPLCYTVTYHYEPLFLADLTKELQESGASVQRISFTTEDGGACTDILDRILPGRVSPPDIPFTRGRFFDGIY